MSPPVELTLVVAATRTMGIGAKGSLPWTGLKKEMAYFARVTKRLPNQVDHSSSICSFSSVPPEARNAVIMGRKTWESIPTKFRPLKGRLNIVISRSFPTPAQSTVDADGDLVRAASLEQALEYLESKSGQKVAKAFVIGGGQIYDAALRLPQTKRLLITRILSEFDCDTFFPLKVADGDDCAPGWVHKSKPDFDAWVGEEVPAGIQEENGTQYEFQMWERVE
ncbi:hypothetical protein jhhlp_001983 [Lomentospora prolificans]|uniref:Dihydrofolate reductase n=1 Tax=Lomentospora prolificans TaxID=41688 RepID=A0A2N3NCU1_9PEZI|nr:hypothetical protein jhhlp_001983 [Lomentospora prolificans]